MPDNAAKLTPYRKFIPEIAGWIGAASFLPQAQKSDVCLFIWGVSCLGRAGSTCVARRPS